MKKRIFLFKVCSFVIAMLFALTFNSCNSAKNAEKRTIMVSILPQQYLLEKIVGDRFEVKCMLAKGGNPETYEPSMSYMMNLENSEAYFLMGNIGFELSIKGKIRDFNPNIKVFDMSEGVDLIHGSHHFDADDEEGIDPHTWTSVANARIIIRNMLDAVCELDPDGKEIYEKNYKAFDKELADFSAALSHQLAAVKGQAFVVWHPSLSYFARDYGLEQISVEYDGKEAPVKYIENKIKYASKRGAKIFFYQKDIDSNQVQSVNSQLGARLVTINPLGYDWKKEIQTIADAFTK